MKKRNMLRKITALLLSVSMLAPTNTFAANKVNLNDFISNEKNAVSDDLLTYSKFYYALVEKENNDDPLYNKEVTQLTQDEITQLPLYSDHPHWNFIIEYNDKHNSWPSNDVAVELSNEHHIKKSTENKLGAADLMCEKCQSHHRVRLPKIEKDIENVPGSIYYRHPELNEIESYRLPRYMSYLEQKEFNYPSVYLKNVKDLTQKEIKQFPIYYEHEHYKYFMLGFTWTENIKGATTKKDGVADFDCSKCPRNHRLRIPKIVKGKLDRKIVNFGDYLSTGSIGERPYLNVTLTDSNHKKIKGSYISDDKKMKKTHKKFDGVHNYVNGSIVLLDEGSYQFFGTQYVFLEPDYSNQDIYKLYDNIRIPASFKFRPMTPALVGLGIGRDYIAVGDGFSFVQPINDLRYLPNKDKISENSIAIPASFIGGFQVALSNNKNFKNSKIYTCFSDATSRVYNKNNSFGGAIFNLKTDTYYLKVRTFNYWEGEKIYSEWSDIKKVNLAEAKYNYALAKKSEFIKFNRNKKLYYYNYLFHGNHMVGEEKKFSTYYDDK